VLCLLCVIPSGARDLLFAACATADPSVAQVSRDLGMTLVFWTSESKLQNVNFSASWMMRGSRTAVTVLYVPLPLVVPMVWKFV
jgi:hypothetical protein